MVTAPNVPIAVAKVAANAPTTNELTVTDKIAESENNNRYHFHVMPCHSAEKFALLNEYKIIIKIGKYKNTNTNVK